MGELIKLKDRAGIDLVYDTQKSKLSLGNLQFSFKARTFTELKDVVLEKTALQGTEEMYLMFRNVLRPEDQKKFDQFKLRYDITIFPPKMIGNQFSLTYGHYHPKISGSDKTHREMYEVLVGDPIFLLQSGSDRIENAIAVHASEGKKVIIGSGFGHVTINPSNSFLVLANIVSSNFESDYSIYKEKGGGCYHFLKEGNKIVPRKNEKYSIVPTLQHSVATDVSGFSGPMYTTFTSNPEKFGFLSKP